MFTQNDYTTLLQLLQQQNQLMAKLLENHPLPQPIENTLDRPVETKTLVRTQKKTLTLKSHLHHDFKQAFAQKWKL